MKFIGLISKSKTRLAQNPGSTGFKITDNIFLDGAAWMGERLNEMDKSKHIEFNPSVNFGFYGLLKYGICLLAFCFSAILLYRVNILLTPLSVVVFYFFEAHFLFLFLLLLDKVPRPVWTSIKLTYKIGIVKAIFTVLPIGVFMVAGIFNFKNPYKNWLTGCLCILIWYQNEIRNRL